MSQVHSANNWEGVDLGDDDRKKKFLRLMGAAKVSLCQLIVKRTGSISAIFADIRITAQLDII